MALSNRELSKETIRQVLMAKGLPNLWIPKLVRIERDLPVMANGKIDIKACKQLAMETMLQSTGE